MKIFIFVVLLVFCVYLVFAYMQTRRLIDIGVELANKAEKFSREIDSDQKFLVIGDSSAVGTGASQSRDSIAGRLGGDFPDASIENLGVNGSKTHELIPRFEALGETQYDLILVQIGGNDIVRWTDLGELEQSIDEVLVGAQKHATNVVLMTSGNVGSAKLLPFGTRWLFTKRTRQVREIFLRVSQKHDVPYVDIFREARDDPFAQEPYVYYAEDIFHPSSVGYEDWYGFVGEVVENISLTSSRAKF